MQPLQLIDAFLRAYFSGDGAGAATRVTRDFRFINVPFPAHVVEGPEALRKLVAEMNGGFPGPVQNARHDIVRSLIDGNFVMHERVDYWTYNGTEMRLDVASLWEVRDGQIRLWKDYFDFGHYIRQFAAVGVNIDLAHFGI